MQVCGSASSLLGQRGEHRDDHASIRHYDSKMILVAIKEPVVRPLSFAQQQCQQLPLQPYIIGIFDLELSLIVC